MQSSGQSLAFANWYRQAFVNLQMLNIPQTSGMNVTDNRITNLKRLADEYPSAAAFGRKFDINPSYISQLINRHRGFGEKAAREIEMKMGLPPGTLDQPPPQPGDNVSSARIEGYVPLISYVQAGEWAEAIDLYEPGYAEQVRATTVPHSMATFALQVEGDSMTLPAGVPGKSFPPGMIIFVDPEREAEVGDFVVARHNGNSKVTFKRLVQEEGRPILVPLNPDRATYPIIRDEFTVIGRVIDASWGGL